MHLAAGKAAKQLPIQVDELLIDIFYFLEKSSKRKQKLKSFQRKAGVPEHKILKHVPTRWLSLGHCIERLLEQWDALLAYFEEEDKTNIPTPTSLKRSRSDCTVNSPPKKQKTGGLPSSSQSVLKAVAKVASSKTVGHTTAKVASSKTVGQTAAKVASSKTVPPTPSSKTPCSKPGSFSKSLNVVPGTGKRPSILKTGTHPTTSKTGASSTAVNKSSSGKSANVTLPKKKTVRSQQSNYASTKSHKVYTTMKDPNYKLYCLFMKKTIPIFEEANVLLQRDEPCIHLLHDVMCGQLRRLLVRFVKPEVVARVPESKVYEVDFHSEANLKSDDDLFIGQQARQFMQENRDCNVEVFYRSVRQYYVAACEYMIKSYPFKDPVLLNAEIINVAKRLTISLSQWLFFVEKFPECLSAEEKEAVEEELCNFQADRLTEDILQPDLRIDQVWHSISKLTSVADGKPKYPSLCKIAELVIVMYHSNADCERIFSIVNKNKTEFRSSLSTRMVGNLMVRRMELLATNTPCHAVTHSKDLLQKAKSAATRGLAGASSQQ